MRTFVIVLIVAVLFKPVIYPFLVSLKFSKFDQDVGRIRLQSTSELETNYRHKKVLIIGGTRGVGKGVAITVAKAGADVTVVGRSTKSGRALLALLEKSIQQDQDGDGDGDGGHLQKMDYIQGDIGSVQTANECIKSLTKYISKNGKFDYLIVTAAIFPYWNDLLNEDGLERSFGIAVVGRYIVYNNAELLLNPNTGRILNVLASGMNDYPFDRDLASGKRIDGSLSHFVMNFACGAELMQIGLSQQNEFYSNLTRVSTNPGILKPYLHRSQGWFMDIVEGVMVKLIGFSEEEAGIRQASILSSPQLVNGRMNYIDVFLKGRMFGLQSIADTHLEWLMDLIEAKVNSKEKI